MEHKIPKTLHYVWVGGGKFTELMTECMASWKVYCPEYEIIEWNESNFDIDGNSWVKKAIEEKNWALASDIMRAWILYEHGGIYIDTDVEILKPLDEFLQYEFFMGYESKHWVNTAIIGSIKGHKVPRLCKERYEFTKPAIDAYTNLLAVHAYSTVMQTEYGIKPSGKLTYADDGIALYPKDYFYPQHYLTHKIKITDNSHTIHRCSCSWHSKGQARAFKFIRFARRIIGRPIFGFFEGMTARRYRKTLRKEFREIEQRKQKAKSEVL